MANTFDQSCKEKRGTRLKIIKKLCTS